MNEEPLFHLYFNSFDEVLNLTDLLEDHVTLNNSFQNLILFTRSRQKLKVATAEKRLASNYLPAGRLLIYQLQLLLHLCSLKLRFSESVVSWPINKQTQPRAMFVKSKVKVKDPRSSASNKYPAEAFGQGLRPDLRFSSASLSILPTMKVSFCQNMAPHFWRRAKEPCLDKQLKKNLSSKIDEVHKEMKNLLTLLLSKTFQTSVSYRALTSACALCVL